MICHRCKQPHRTTWTRTGQVAPVGDMYEGECEDDEAEGDELPFECCPTDLFHLGIVDEIYRCKGCGSTEFTVGSGDWSTSIKCPRCGWEHEIHNA